MESAKGNEKQAQENSLQKTHFKEKAATGTPLEAEVEGPLQALGQPGLYSEMQTKERKVG